VSSAAVRVARAAAAQSLTWDENDDGDKVISQWLRDCFIFFF